MKILIAKIAKILTTTVALSVAIAVDAPKAEAISLIEKDLFFGRNISGGGEVSEAEFEAFVDTVITPLFPDGLTIFDADGQFRDEGTIIQEQSKVVTLFVENTPQSDTAINEIVLAYLQQFDQESVLQVTNEDELKVGFGVGENLIDNNLVPEFIQADLFFGRNIPSGGEVSEADFQEFVDNFITPSFPNGLTIFDADGQFRDNTNTIIQEQSKVLTLLFEDTQQNEDAIDDIIEEYLAQFNQQSVLLVVDEDVEVAFDASPTTSVPEPSSILGLLMFGTGLVLKRKFSLSGNAIKLRNEFVSKQ